MIIDFEKTNKWSSRDIYFQETSYFGFLFTKWTCGDFVYFSTCFTHKTMTTYCTNHISLIIHTNDTMFVFIFLFPPFVNSGKFFPRFFPFLSSKLTDYLLIFLNLNKVLIILARLTKLFIFFHSVTFSFLIPISKFLQLSNSSWFIRNMNQTFFVLWLCFNKVS